MIKKITKEQLERLSANAIEQNKLHKEMLFLSVYENKRVQLDKCVFVKTFKDFEYERICLRSYVYKAEFNGVKFFCLSSEKLK